MVRINLSILQVFKCVVGFSVLMVGSYTNAVEGLPKVNEVSSDHPTENAYVGFMRSKRSTAINKRVCTSWGDCQQWEKCKKKCVGLTALQITNSHLYQLALKEHKNLSSFNVENLRRKFDNIPSRSPFLMNYADSFTEWLNSMQQDGFLCRTSQDCSWVDSQIMCHDYEVSYAENGNAFTTLPVTAEWFGKKDEIRGACMCSDGFRFNSETLTCYDYDGPTRKIILGCTVGGIVVFVLIVVICTWDNRSKCFCFLF